MELLVVGSGAAYPDRPGTASSTYLVRHADAVVCLDLGQGGFAGIAGRCPPEDLLGVVVSHLHPDHFVDLVPLRHFLRYEFAPGRRVRVIAPAGLARRLDGLMDEAGFCTAILDIEDRSVGELMVGPFLVESRRVLHTDDSYATRVSLAGSADEPGLVYSGDCGRADDLVPLVRPGDTLLTEIAWGAGPAPVTGIHLDGSSIGELARATAPGLVLLTHLQPRRDARAAIEAVRALFDGEVRLVRDGDRISLERTSPIRLADQYQSPTNPA